jgi:hypothetical protein
MICDRCLGRTRVIETRTPEKRHNRSSIEKLLNAGDTVFGWWSSDFEMRRRRCSRCGIVFETIEVSVVDLRNAFDDIEDNKPIGKPWKSEVQELPSLEKTDSPDVGGNWRTQSNLCGQ